MLAGVADLRKVIAEATERRRLYQRRTILFIDEVHRWNKPNRMLCSRMSKVVWSL